MTNANKASGNSGVRKNMSSMINKGKGMMKGSNKVVMALVGLFVIIIIGMIVYWVYNAIMKASDVDSINPIIIAGDKHTKDMKPVHMRLPVMANSNAPNLSYTISFWVYVERWEDQKEKVFMYKGGKDDTITENDTSPPEQFSMFLKKNTNTLVVRTALLNNSPTHQECNIHNFPLQKWVHVGYVLDNRTVDVYVNCKLERSCLLANIPKLHGGELHVPKHNNKPNSNSNIYGKIASVRYFSEALRPVDIVQICNEGPFATRGMKEGSTPNNDESGDDCPPSSIITSKYKELKDALDGINFEDNPQTCDDDACNATVTTTTTTDDSGSSCSVKVEPFRGFY